MESMIQDIFTYSRLAMFLALASALFGGVSVLAIVFLVMPAIRGVNQTIVEAVDAIRGEGGEGGGPEVAEEEAEETDARDE